jgi:molybdopterin converting factor small subunit
VKIEASPATLRDALGALWALHPGIRDRVMTEQGEIREHVNVFVGNEDIRYTGGLNTALPAGTEISIVPAVSGGGIFEAPTANRKFLLQINSDGVGTNHKIKRRKE